MMTSQLPQFNPDGSLLRRQQMRILDILLVVDGICRRHSLDYWIGSGTLLGAARHKGFIPWDDDIDIEMPTEHYNRLLEILPHELPSHLKLQTADTDPGYFYTYAKVRDTRSHLEDIAGYDRIFKYQGLYIDIFPVERTHRWLHWISQRTHGRTYVAFKNNNDDAVCLKKVRRILWWNNKFVFPVLRALAKLMPCRTYYGLGIPFSKERRIDCVYPLRDMDFEGHKLLAPRDADTYLRHLYGDYMRLPDLTKLAQHTAKLTIDHE